LKAKKVFELAMNNIKKYKTQKKPKGGGNPPVLFLFEY